MDDINREIQVAIDSLINKADSMGFKFSASKTVCMHFCRLRRVHDDPHLVIKGTPIAVKSKVKCLGLILDPKLTWKLHIDDLATRCKKSLNVLRCMSNINWGADREVLLNLYKSLVLSKMDYGSAVYSSARPSRLKILESIHCTGIRLATGAFRTSPLPAICCEAGIPPLRFRRTQLLINFSTTIWAQPTHPLHKLLFNDQQNENYQGRPTISRPLGVRMQESLENLNISVPRVFPLGFCEVPPWKVPSLDINMECASFLKKDTNNLIFRAMFSDIINRREYSETEIIYTDGSKTGNGVGSAFSVSGEAYSWTLPSSAHIFSAEIYAIHQALLYCTQSHHTTFTICSDSLSVLQSLNDIFTRNTQIQQTLALLYNAWISGKTIRFIWTPGHVGIPGNEIVDEAAHSAAEVDTPEDVPIYSEDFKTAIKLLIKESWQREWNTLESKLKTIKPTVNIWKTPSQLSRREEVALTRLRIGHTHLTSSHLLANNGRPICQHCQMPLTVPHIILLCPVFAHHRQTFLEYNDLARSLSNTRESVKAIILYITATGLLKKI